MWIPESESFGDVAGDIRAQQMEWHAALAWALQGGEAVAGLFEAHSEPVLEQFDIIAVGLGGLVEGVIGHQERAREVVGQRDPGEGAPIFIGEVPFVHQHVDLAVCGE